jgi:hypothetical protein
VTGDIADLRAELQCGRTPERVVDEIGDVLLAVVNIACHLEVDAEAALRRTNAKFERRLSSIETGFRAEGCSPDAASLPEMEALWQRRRKRGNKTGRLARRYQLKIGIRRDGVGPWFGRESSSCSSMFWS